MINPDNSCSVQIGNNNVMNINIESETLQQCPRESKKSVYFADQFRIVQLISGMFGWIVWGLSL